MGIYQAFIDLETTGLNKDVDELIQIGCVFEIDFQIVDILEINCKPSAATVLSEFSEKNLGMSKQELLSDASRLSQKDTLALFLERLQTYISPYNTKAKFQFIGYNCRIFDAPFLRRFFERNGNKFYGSYFWEPPTDVMILAADALVSRRTEIGSFKLENIAQEFGISVDPSQCHSALYDVLLTRDLYYSLKEK